MATLSAPGLSVPQLDAAANVALAGSAQTAARSKAAEKAKLAAQDFEAVFINTMFQQMFSNIGQGQFGGGPAAGVWRSLLTDEYAKSLAKNGGIGLASHVARALLAQQEVQ